ncbi:hypothetical protein ONZ51_g7743 [Trametes cubensis]|uniref:Uncharacterized protein n=1 Tax=Trametes cubensis TaxID=1111947 RepID=A0AAD7TQ18_9APHY|nr:hypothetical protein ONZ51_g7743 [Trametes cubensis]
MEVDSQLDSRMNSPRIAERPHLRDSILVSHNNSISPPLAGTRELCGNQAHGNGSLSLEAMPSSAPSDQTALAILQTAVQKRFYRRDGEERKPDAPLAQATIHASDIGSPH